MIESSDVFAIADAGSERIGYGFIRSWTEDNGTRVFLVDGYIAPAFRRRGLGTSLMIWLERNAVDLARSVGNSEYVVLGGNASSVQPDKRALLERFDFKHVFTQIEMRLATEPDERLLPTEYSLRDITVNDAEKLIDLTGAVWAGRDFFTMHTVDGFRGWLSRSQLDLFQVAEDAIGIVGFVASSRSGAVAEIEDVQVHPRAQRKGIATSLVSQNITRLRDLGVEEIRLNTEAHDPAGARSLYEKLGFELHREYLRFRKPLREN